MSETRATDGMTIDELINRAELTQIVFHELSAKRKTDAPPLEGTPDRQEAELPIEISFRQHDDVLEFGCRFQIETRRSEFSLLAVAQFTLPESRKVDPDELDPDPIGDFISGNVIPLVYPYVREAVHNLAARLGDNVLLGVLSRSALNV